jgi:hypothetical protein
MSHLIIEKRGVVAVVQRVPLGGAQAAGDMVLRMTATSLDSVYYCTVFGTTQQAVSFIPTLHDRGCQSFAASASFTTDYYRGDSAAECIPTKQGT